MKLKLNKTQETIFQWDEDPHPKENWSLESYKVLIS